MDPQLCETVKDVAEHLGVLNLKASNRLLDRWRKTEIDEEQWGGRISWKERLTTSVQGYLR